MYVWFFMQTFPLIFDRNWFVIFKMCFDVAEEGFPVLHYLYHTDSVIWVLSWGFCSFLHLEIPLSTISQFNVFLSLCNMNFVGAGFLLSILSTLPYSGLRWI
jgi:hypothetical protein